jgi:hypothetical protein
METNGSTQIMQVNYYAQKRGKFGLLRVSGDHVSPIALGDNIPAAHEAFSKGISVLESLNVNHYVSAGTVLGIVRDKGFIKHDTDLDVEIITSYATPVDINAINEAMVKSGFRLIRTVFDDDHSNKVPYPKQLAYMTEDNVVFDLWFVYTDVDDGYVVTFSEYGKMKTPASMVSDLTKKRFIIEEKEYDIKLPNNLDDYCEMRYGKTWRTPKTSKGPWQDDAGNLE